MSSFILYLAIVDDTQGPSLDFSWEEEFYLTWWVVDLSEPEIYSLCDTDTKNSDAIGAAPDDVHALTYVIPWQLPTRSCYYLHCTTKETESKGG